MGLELLREADKVLDVCGRPVPPPGYKFLDLPRVIPWQGVMTAQAEGPIAPPFVSRVLNNAPTLFICRAIASSGDLQYRVKWPSGRFLSQGLSGDSNDSGVCFPTGTGNGMLGLNAPEPVGAGAAIAIEVGGQVVGTQDLQFCGVLRYLLKDTGAGFDKGEVSCIVGYPAESTAPRKHGRNVEVTMIEDPIEALESRPRYFCGPNQNIMDPEFLLGNQCTPETPEGYEDEPFTFFSDPFFVAVADNRYSLAVILPGNEDVLIRRIRAKNEYTPVELDPQTSAWGVPVFSMRLPNGYNVTGGDLIPASGAWLPFFPMLLVRSGDRLIFDLSNVDASPGGNPAIGFTTTFEFDAVKRRKVAA